MDTTALVGGTVVDVLEGQHQEDAMVLVQGDRITAVGPRDQVDFANVTDVVDVRGHWVMPGLVDMHTHVTLSGTVPLELFLANGVTTIRDPGGRAAEERLLRDALERGERIGPRLYFSGEVLDGYPPVWPSASLLVDTPQRAEAAVRHLAAQGVDCLKIYNHVSESALSTIVRVAQELSLPVMGHVPRSMSMRDAITLGMTCLEHIRVTGRDFLPPDEAAALDALPAGEREPRLWGHIDLAAPWVHGLVEAMLTHDVFLDPTLIMDEVLFVHGLGAQRSHPDNDYLPPDVRASWEAEPVPQILEVPERLRTLAEECVAKKRDFVRMCATAGVRILAGTDGVGLGRLMPGFSLHHELEILRSLGLSGLSVLQSATIDAATALGCRESNGSVDAGKLADLVVARRDPVSQALRPGDLELVMVGGSRHDPIALTSAAASEAPATARAISSSAASNP